MKIIFKASFLKSIEKIKDSCLKSDIVNAIENVEQAKDLRSIANLKKLNAIRVFTGLK